MNIFYEHFCMQLKRNFTKQVKKITLFESYKTIFLPVCLC